MFDINSFKRRIQVWTEQNPEGSKNAFLDYCEELIPSNEYSQYSWLLEQAAMWFEHKNKNKENPYTA